MNIIQVSIYKGAVHSFLFCRGVKLDHGGVIKKGFSIFSTSDNIFAGDISDFV